MYQCLVKLSERRNSEPSGLLSFPTAEARLAYVKGPTVYWYHYAEEDDWHTWLRGGAWSATAEPGPADRINEPPELTQQDRERW
jgi:hypothetical protein